MIGITALVALFFALIALTRRNNGAAVGVLILSMLAWPEYLRIPLGIFESSVPRLVALLLLAKAIGSGRHQQMSSCAVDRYVFLLWAWTMLAAVVSGAPLAHFTQMTGRGLDTVLIYFVVRLYIVKFDDLKGMIWWLALGTAGMGIVGAVEAFTGKSPYAGMTEYRVWKWFDENPPQYRLGLMRARASTSVHIFYGLAMMIVSGILWSINMGLPRNRFRTICILLGFVGALSSMSSGPWLACGMLFLFGLYRHRLNLIKPSLLLIVFASVVLELASNRHFYNLIDYLALDSHTAWYRTRLLEIAFSQLSEFWLIGIGADWPHQWGMLLDGRAHIDVVNHFLIIALYGGIPAMTLYLLAHWYALKRIGTLLRWASGTPLGIAAFNLGVVLVSLDFATMSVGLFGPPLLLSHVLLALIVSITGHEKPAAISPVPLASPSHDVQRSLKAN